MVRKKRSFFVLPLIILAFSVVGSYYGPGVQAAITEPGSEQSGLNSDVADFTKFYELVEKNFAEPVIRIRRFTKARFRACCARSIRTRISSTPGFPESA